jgi:alpha-tubulin suppressor-like RCC1 family protein
MDTSNWQTILKNFNKVPFVLTQISRFTTEQSILTIQQKGPQNEPLIGIFNKEDKKIEVYDSQFGKFPLFVYQLFENNVKLVYLTEKLIFVVASAERSYKLIVISKHLSGTSANPRAGTPKLHRDVKLQEFEFPSREIVRGAFPAFKYNTLLVHQSHQPSSVTNELSSDDSKAFEIKVNLLWPLEGFYIWSYTTIYEVKPKDPPERIFFQLLAQVSPAAESFGKTFGLDLFALYELAADQYLLKGDYGRALDLYYLSNVRISKFIAKFLSIGRMDVIITRLRATLSEPQALSMNERKYLSNTLLQCYLQRLLQKKNQKLDEEFQTFLRRNEDYDAYQALELFMQYGFIRYFLLVAESRNLMTRGLNMIATERGCLHLSQDELTFLKDNYHLESLKMAANGVLVRCLPTNYQIKLYLEDPLTTYKYFDRIYALLPDLDEETLIVLAKHFDPLGETMIRVFNFKTTRMSGTLSNQIEEEIGGAATKEDYIELFLTILLVLNYRRRQQNKISFRRSRKVSQIRSQIVQGVQQKLAAKIACGCNHTCVITDDQNVYVWGRNSAGQLGLGDTINRMTPQKIEGLSHVSVIACGGEHTIAIDDNGLVFSWGNNSNGQLGHGDFTQRLKPTLLEKLSPLKVKCVACGFHHSMILTDNGLYVFGRGAEGQLGLGDRDDRNIPQLISSIENTKTLQWKQIACGCNHNALLLETGEVYVWGSSQYGQLGLGDTEDSLVPKVVPSLLRVHVKSISCGSFHTAAINDLGNVYIWGRSHPDKSPEVPNVQLVPKLVDSLFGKKVALIASGHTHTMAVTEKGEVYLVWGQMSNTKPGDSESVSTVTDTPIPIPELKGKNIKAICCGENFTLALTDKGSVYSWGSGQYGQLGHGDMNDQPVPKLVDSLNEILQYRILRDRESDSSKATLVSDITTKPHPDSEEEETYGQAILENTLKGWESGNSRIVNKVSYRTSVILERALQWQNYLAASLIAFQTKQWELGVYCRLKHLETTFVDVKDVESGTEERSALLELINILAKNAAQITNCEELFYQVLRYWNARQHPVKPLEEFLTQNSTYTVPLLGSLLEMPTESIDRPLCLDFSLDFYLIITKKCLERMKNEYDIAQNERVSEEKFWDSIKNNLVKDIGKKEKIVIPLPIRQEGSEYGQDNKYVIFTCGHHFTRNYLNERVIPQLKQRLELLPTPLPITSKLVIADYAQSFINLACPVCLYNHLRQKQSQMHPNARLEKWEL